MGRTLDDIHKLLEFIIHKERGIFITPAQKDAILDAGQMEVYEEFFSEYGTTETIHDALSTFKVNYQFTSAADGTVTPPSNCLHILPNVFTVTGSTINKVRFVDEDGWVDAIKGQLRAVSTSKPIAKDYGNGFNLYPETTQIGKFTYLRRPATPVYAYTLGGTANRTVTYNSAGSTQLEWQDSYINKIIARALGYAGIHMSEEDVAAFGAAKDQQITQDIS